MLPQKFWKLLLSENAFGPFWSQYDVKTRSQKRTLNVDITQTVNALTTVGALMTLTDFILSNARRFYSSMGNPLAVQGLNVKMDFLAQRLLYVWILQF